MNFLQEKVSSLEENLVQFLLYLILLTLLTSFT